MDRLYVFQYLMDGAGNYILDGDGKTIVNATAEYPVDMAAAGVASYRGRPRRVNSFSILANDAGDDWTLIINQYDLVGRYPSQAVAIGALIGCFIHANADQEGLEFIISEMVQNGTGQIDEDGDNLMSQRISNGTFTGTLRNFNKDLFTGTSNSMQQDKLVVGATVETLLLNDPLQTISVPARYDSSFAFEVRTDKPSPNAIVLPAEVIGPLSNANLGFPVTTPLTGVRYYADFSVDGLDSRIPVTVEYTWLTSSDNGTTWIERQSSTTNYYEPADNEAGLRLRCEVEVFYLDSTSTGITSSESTGAIGKIWTWRSGSAGQPLLIESTVGQTLQVSPTFNASFQETGYGEGGGLSFTNDFTRDGTTVQNTTSAFYNYGGTAGTYDCDVTATQTFNGITYTSTSMAAPTFVRASSQDVQFIRLFTALGPSGTDVTDNPPANTSLYAYAYSDLAGTQLITNDVTFTYSVEGSGVVPGSGFTGATPQPADVLPGAGETFALDSMPVAHWSELPLRTVEGDSIELNVVADHYNGIDRVEFIANDGTPTAVTSTVTKYDEDPNFGTDVYSAQLDMSGVAAGDTVEVRATIYPTAGRPRVLQGGLVWVATASNDGKEGKRSSYITKISGVTQVVVSSGTVIDAIDGLDVTGTTQYELAFAPGTFELGASSVPAVTGVNQNIPIRILGSGGRSTRIIRSTYDGVNWMGGFPLEWENCTIVASTFGLQASGNPNAMNIFKDCSLIGEYEPYVGSYTDGTGTITAQEFIDYNTLTPDLGPNSNITIWGADQRNGTGFTSTPVFSASSNEQRGVYLQDCTIDLELGSGVLWMRSTTSVNAIGDNSHCAAVIGLRTEGSSYGGYVDVNLLKKDYLVWEPNRAYADGDNVIVPKGVLLDYDPTDENGNNLSRYRMHIFKCVENHTAPAEFVYDANWSDPLPPHIDGWQGRRTQSGDHTFDNIWISEFTTDDKCSHQPFLYRELELLTNMIWKNWDIVAVSYPNTQIAQMATHVNHWLVDNVVFPDGDPALTGPELRLQWNDPAYPSAANGWGDDLSTDVGFESVGCRNSKWSNSKMRNLILGASWGDGNLPADMTAFQTQMNSNAGAFVGWDLAIDASTITDSYLDANSPEVPYNAATTQGAGTSEVGDTISVTTSADGTEPITRTYVWDLDGNVVAGEDAATYPKTGTIPSGDEGKVPKCTVTYTNAYGSDEDSHTFAAVAPVGGAETWDTYEDGIFKVPLASQNPSGSFVKATVAYGSTTTASAGFEGWYRSVNFPASRYWNGSADTLPPTVAVWNETTQTWLGWSNPGTPGGSTIETVKWNQNGSTPDYWTFAHQDHELYVVYLSQDPADFGSWGAYDGPKGNDWDADEVGAGDLIGYTTNNEFATFDASYPLEAPAVDPKIKIVGNFGGSYLECTFATAANRANMPEYVAIYISAAEAAASGGDLPEGAYAQTEGWYLYGPGVDQNPGVNGVIRWVPKAWPTGGSNGEGSGYLWTNGNAYKVGVVFKTAYSGADGEGGTDGWSPCPFDLS